MHLSLTQAAARMGKSVRQIRYMIAQDRLSARKVGGRWVIDDSELPLTEGQQQASERKQRQLRAAVDKALELPERLARYSVRDLKAFQIALPLYHSCRTDLGAEHAASHALRQVIEQLSCGCHRFERADKATAYRRARDAASQAVCELLIADPAHAELAERILTTIEQDLMAALAGLLRRLEPRRKR